MKICIRKEIIDAPLLVSFDEYVGIVEYERLRKSCRSSRSDGEEIHSEQESKSDV